MTITFTIELDRRGASREALDAVRRHAGIHSDADAAPGMLVHLESETGAGYRIVDVWESAEHFERFMDERLGAAFAAADFHPLDGPPSVEPVLNLVLGARDRQQAEAADPAAVARAFFTEMCDGRRLDLAEQLLAEDHVYYDPASPGEVRGRQAMVDTVRLYQEAVDGHWEIRDVVPAGSYVTVRWQGSGRHVGDLMGLPPTGREVSVSALSLLRLENGKIAENWTNWDTAGLLRQVGVLPGQIPDQTRVQATAPAPTG